uniref:Uncharacterized protein n=1 Tax=Rhizophora mucronata TaxID=61149 RepID=A0A2P2NA41_RHIMU
MRIIIKASTQNDYKVPPPRKTKARILFFLFLLCLKKMQNILL